MKSCVKLGSDEQSRFCRLMVADTSSALPASVSVLVFRPWEVGVFLFLTCEVCGHHHLSIQQTMGNCLELIYGEQTGVVLAERA